MVAVTEETDKKASEVVPTRLIVAQDEKGVRSLAKGTIQRVSFMDGLFIFTVNKDGRKTELIVHFDEMPLATIIYDKKPGGVYKDVEFDFDDDM